MARQSSITSFVEDAFVFEKDGSVPGIPDEVIRRILSFIYNGAGVQRSFCVGNLSKHEMVGRKILLPLLCIRSEISSRFTASVIRRSRA